MNDNEWKRVEDAVSLIVSTDQQVSDLLGGNSTKVAEQLKIMAKAQTDAAMKKHIESVVAPAFKDVQNAAKEEQSLMRKFETDSKKDRAGCADAKAFYDKWAKLATSFDVLHKYGAAWVLHLISDADAAKLRAANKLAGVSKLSFRYPKDTDRQIAVMVGTLENYDAAYQRFAPVWAALAKPPARPTSAAPATPPKRI